MTDTLGSCDYLIFAKILVTQDAERRIIYDAAVAVDGSTVIDVGQRDEVAGRRAATTVLDMGNGLLMPGLVNGHTHLPMTLLRGAADDLPLIEWLQKHIWPREAKLTDELLLLGATLGCAEMIRTGTTCFINGYFHEEQTGTAVDRAGLRAVLGEGFFGFPSPLYATPQECWDTTTALRNRYAGHPRIQTSIFPHAAFTVEPEHLSASYELAENLGIQWQIHLAESPAETVICVEKYGRRPVELLASLNLLSPRTVLHHCVDLNDEEMVILAETGTHVIHNPASNLKLASGIARIQELVDRGVKVGLGTDGAASNNQLNMFRDMGLAALLGKVRADDASAVSAQTVLDMATLGSAAALGWPELGRIVVGGAADLICLDLDQPNMMPLFNPISHVVYAATGTEVRMTMAAGQVLYKDGEYFTLDMKELRAGMEAAVRWAQTGVSA